MTFFSPGTDVPARSNYDVLPKNTSISMTSGTLHIKPGWRVLGPAKAKILPALHTFFGADNIGHFAWIGKLTRLKVFLDAYDNITRALFPCYVMTQV